MPKLNADLTTNVLVITFKHGSELDIRLGNGRPSQPREHSVNFTLVYKHKIIEITML